MRYRGAQFSALYLEDLLRWKIRIEISFLNIFGLPQCAESPFFCVRWKIFRTQHEVSLTNVIVPPVQSNVSSSSKPLFRSNVFSFFAFDSGWGVCIFPRKHAPSSQWRCPKQLAVFVYNSTSHLLLVFKLGWRFLQREAEHSTSFRLLLTYPRNLVEIGNELRHTIDNGYPAGVQRDTKPPPEEITNPHSLQTSSWLAIKSSFKTAERTTFQGATQVTGQDLVYLRSWKTFIHTCPDRVILDNMEETQKHKGGLFTYLDHCPVDCSSNRLSTAMQFSSRTCSQTRIRSLTG